MKIKIGVIQKPFGIKGEVKVKALTDSIKERFALGKKIEVVFERSSFEYEIESVRTHQGSLLVKFKGLNTLNDVEHFHQGILQINKSDMEELEDDEFYFSDIIGYTVLVDDVTIGTITEVMDLPAHEVLRVKTDEKDVLIPFVDAFIKEVDTDNEIIRVIGMEGLL